MKEPTLTTPLARAILSAYLSGEEDELLEPYVLVDSRDQPLGRLEQDDSLIFYDIRGEREVELTLALTDKAFAHFPVRNLDLSFATMIRYRKNLDVKVAFPPLEGLKNNLVEVLSRGGKRVVKVTEAEKAIHLAYFLSGKREEPYPGEERIVVPTRKDIATFDQAPEMSAAQVVEAASLALRDTRCDVIIVNLCNVDVVGHFENENAVIKAVETVDDSLGRIIARARENGVTSIITADHGTVEHWLYPEGAVDTGHTRSPVPLILDTKEAVTLRPEGELADVAPTMLDILGITKPEEMTGRSLIENGTPRAQRLLLLILDGWGHNPDSYGNMIRKARTPNFDELLSSRPHSILAAAGEAVGLPERSVGNSEVGHLTIGAGRRVPSDRVRIDQSIADGSFMSNPAFLWAIDQAKSNRKALHLMGIVSFYSSHGSIKHLEALLELCRRERVSPVYIHAMLGRRGEKPQAGARYVGMIEERCRELGVGKVVGVIGRYWSLDREENWDRIERTWRWLVGGEGKTAQDIEQEQRT